MTKPPITHVTDQLGAMFEDMAPMLKQLYDGLVTAGFTQEQAFDLTKVAFEKLIERGKSLSAEREISGGH